MTFLASFVSSSVDENDSEGTDYSVGALQGLLQICLEVEAKLRQQVCKKYI